MHTTLTEIDTLIAVRVARDRIPLEELSRNTGEIAPRNIALNEYAEQLGYQLTGR